MGRRVCRAAILLWILPLAAPLTGTVAAQDSPRTTPLAVDAREAPRGILHTPG